MSTRFTRPLAFNAALIQWPNNRGELTQTQVNELLAGEWTVRIGLEGYLGSVIEGQILVVPEPSTLAITAAAALLIYALKFSPKRRQV
jgi:hypothetical protein